MKTAEEFYDNFKFDDGLGMPFRGTFRDGFITIMQQYAEQYCEEKMKEEFKKGYKRGYDEARLEQIGNRRFE